MPQQVWTFLVESGDAWDAATLCRRLNMPYSTVRGQLRRLQRDGRVTAYPYAGRILYRKAG